MKQVFVDQIHRKLELEGLPQRIVSLVPSQSEYLFALGMGERVVGITKFCVHPKSWFENKVKVGGTKNVDIEKVLKLNSDFIIANKEENRLEDIDFLSARVPTYVSDVNGVEEAYQMMSDIGRILGCEPEAQHWIGKWTSYFQSKKFEGGKKRVVYVIWKDPIMLVGKGTYIDSYLEAIGYENAVSEPRYPRLDECELREVEEVLLSSEPFPFKNTDFSYFQTFFPNAKIRLVDGEQFSWYGARNVI